MSDVADFSHDGVVAFQAPLRASIVLIGDELLDGWVADSNAHWLAGRLSSAGIPLDRIHTVPDAHEAIDEALKAELSRSRPRVVVTSGGIGSTHDDLTMAAIAGHLDQQLVAHPEILARIDRLVDRTTAAGSPIDPEQVAAIRRMAMVPADSRILVGSTGMIPGVVVDVDGGSAMPDGATIVVLPGVPGQFREIVERAVEPELLAGRGRPQRVAEFTHSHPESAFTGVLDRLVHEHPDLTIGSYPGSECVIRVKGADEDIEAALHVLRAHTERLENDPSAVRRRQSWRRRQGEQGS